MATTLTAHVKNGVIVPDEEIALEEGAKVEVRISHGAPPDGADAGRPNSHRSGLHANSLEEARAIWDDPTKWQVDEETRRKSFEELYRHTVNSGLPAITNEEIDALLTEEYGSTHDPGEPGA